MDYGWKPYVSVAARRAKAERHAAQLKKKGQALSPVSAGSTIVKTFWGKAWSDNLERYSDYANRLPRGRTYLRNGSVIDLAIAAGKVSAQVMGSELYKISVTIAAVPAPQWQAVSRDCAGSIDSLVELLQGRLSQGVMERICQAGTGLFPAPKEIKFECSCPDWAGMCKHVAAVFYGVGVRLDEQPELLFTLRCVDAKELVARAGVGLALPEKGPAAGRVLDEAKLGGIFGIEMMDTAIADAPVAMPAAVIKPRGGKKAAVYKSAIKKSATKKPPAATKVTAVTARKKKVAPAKKKAV